MTAKQPNETDTPSDAPRNVIEQLVELGRAERRKAVAEYRALLERADAPRKGDANKLQELLTVLGRATPDAQADLEAFRATRDYRAAQEAAQAAAAEISKARAVLSNVEAEYVQARKELEARYLPRIAELQTNIHKAEGPANELRRLQHDVDLLRLRQRWEALEAGELDPAAYAAAQRAARRAAKAPPPEPRKTREDVIRVAMAELAHYRRGTALENSFGDDQLRETINAALRHHGFGPLSDEEFAALDPDPLCRAGRQVATAAAKVYEEVATAVVGSRH